MNDAQEHRLALMAEGREAIAMMGLLRPYVDSKMMNLVHGIVAAYRSNRADLPLLLGVAAQMACLMDLLSDLDSRARRGDVAAQKELNGGQGR